MSSDAIQFEIRVLVLLSIRWFKVVSLSVLVSKIISFFFNGIRNFMICSQGLKARKMSGGGEKGSATTKTPADFLKSIRGRPVVVKLNSGVDYRGMSTRILSLSCSFFIVSVALLQGTFYFGRVVDFRSQFSSSPHVGEHLTSKQFLHY